MGRRILTLFLIFALILSNLTGGAFAVPATVKHNQSNMMIFLSSEQAYLSHHHHTPTPTSTHHHLDNCKNCKQCETCANDTCTHGFQCQCHSASSLLPTAIIYATGSDAYSITPTPTFQLICLPLPLRPPILFFN